MNTTTYGSVELFEIHMFTPSLEYLHGFIIPFDSLAKGALLEIKDVATIKQRPASRDLEATAMLQKIVHSWIITTILMPMILERVASIKEELVANVWHPRRLSRRLEEGGWEAVDAFT
jgi:hypothetical protein